MSTRICCKLRLSYRSVKMVKHYFGHLYIWKCIWEYSRTALQLRYFLHAMRSIGYGIDCFLPIILFLLRDLLKLSPELIFAGFMDLAFSRHGIFVSAFCRDFLPGFMQFSETGFCMKNLRAQRASIP